jgi:hypothetical protein
MLDEVRLLQVMQIEVSDMLMVQLIILQQEKVPQQRQILVLSETILLQYLEILAIAQ